MDNKIISNLSAAGMLRILCNYKKTGIYNIDTQNKNVEIYIKNGDIVKVKPEEKNVKELLIEVLSSLNDISFYFEDKNIEGSKSFDICIEDVILESARRIAKDGSNDLIRDFIFSDNEVLKICKFPTERTVYIKFLSEEWNLLSSFDGSKSINSVIAESKIDNKKAEIILYGLISAGLLRRTRFKMPELTKIVREELGNIGVAVVDTEFLKNNIDKTKMGMKEFLRLLASLENSFAEIVGRTKAQKITDKIWEATK